MVAWFIIAIATLGVFAFIAVNGVQTVASTTDGVGRIEIARRMDAAVTALIARSGSPGNTGRMMILAGTSIDGIYGLPAELTMYATTPFGQRLVYCPFGDGEAGTSSTNVPVGGGTSYAIQTRADASGRVFVTSGRPSLPQVVENPNLMGYLIAPRTKTSPTPTCASVRYNTTTRRFEAPDAFVRPIIRAASADDQRQQAARDVVYYVSPSGTGRGLAPNDPTSMYTAVTYYRANLPQSMRIVMSAGNYVLPGQYLNATSGGFSDKGNAGTLVIDGQGGAQLDFESMSDIWVPGNLELRNLTVSTAVGIWSEQGHKLTLQNTSTGYVDIRNGGSLYAVNASIHNQRGAEFAFNIVNGSSAVINGNFSVTGLNGGGAMRVGSGSRLAFENSAVNIASTGSNLYLGIFAEENSDLTFRSSPLVYNTSATFSALIYGRASFYNSNVQTNVSTPRLFELQKGGYLSLNGGTFGLGVAPLRSIIDTGAGGVTGTATIRASESCWTNVGAASGVQFVRSGAGNVTGGNSAVTANQNPAAMSPNPTAAEVTANADIMAANTQRQQLRNTNTSSFTCQIG